MSINNPHIASPWNSGRAIACFALIVAAATFTMAKAAEPEKTSPVKPAPKAKGNYERPFEPPTRPVLVPLPPGAIRPEGWLRDWCMTAKDGYTGHMDDVDIAFRQAWAKDYKMTGDKLSLWDTGGWPYEGGGYWFEGLAKLGFVLHDKTLTDKTNARLGVVVDNMNPNSIMFLWWLDKNKPEDLAAVLGRGKREEEWPIWANGLLGRAMVGYYAGSGDPKIFKALETAYSSNPDWVKLGWGMIHPWPAFETYTWTGNKQIKDALTDLFTKDGDDKKLFSWNIFRRPPPDKPEPDHGVHFCESTAPWALGYLWTGKREFLDAALLWHEKIERDCMQPHGVPVFDEYYGPTGAFRGSETCDIAGYMWSNNLLLSISGQGRLADRIERAFFNAAPAAISRDFKSHAYFQSPNRMADKSLPAAEPFSFQEKRVPLCCTASLNRILPNYVINMWMATQDNGLAAVCYGPCKVSALVADRVPVEIVCKTDYPFNETIEITVNPEREAKFPLSFRIPGWCKDAQFSVNDSAVEVAADANNILRIERLWKPNDKINIRFPMSPQVATGKDANAGDAPYATVSYGPLLFALPIAEGKDLNTPDPAAKWHFALDSQTGNASADITVERSPMPGKWDWPLKSPLKLRAHAIGIDWKPTLKEPLPAKPYQSDKPQETITLVPYGCTKFRVSMFPVTNWTSEMPTPPKESEGWGPERDGLRTRLLPAQKEYFVGRMAKFRLEMKNFGKQARMYDAQGADVNGSIRITDPDGKPVSYVAGSFQTSGTSHSIASGEKVDLFNYDSLDLAEQYLFVKPGSYTLQFRGLSGHPAFKEFEGTSDIPLSGEITIQMRSGMLPISMQVPARLVEILPKGWDLSLNMRVSEVEKGKISPPGWESGPGTYVTLITNSNKEDGGIGVAVWVAEKKLAWTGKRPFWNGTEKTSKEVKPEEGAVYLGKGIDGHVYWTLPKDTEKVWPDIQAKVKAALKIENPAPTGP